MHDAQKTVSLDESNVKGWSRLAKAHLQLLQPDEAKDALGRGLALDAKNKDLLRIQVRLFLRLERQYGTHMHELTRHVGSRTGKAGRASDAASMMETSQPEPPDFDCLVLWEPVGHASRRHCTTT